MFTCSKCNGKFTTKRNYNYHTDNKVCEKKCGDFKCNECGTNYKYKSSLKRHLMKVHKIPENDIDIDNCSSTEYTCSLCNKKFVSKGNLNKHLKSNCQKNKQTQIISTQSGGNTIINNGTIINNNNVQINVNLNNFGEEKVDEKEIIKLLEKTNLFNIKNFTLNFIKLKHVITDENRNIYIKHKHGKKAYVYQKKWSKMEKDDAFHKIRCKTIDDINDCLENNTKYDNVIINNQLDKLQSMKDKKFNRNFNKNMNEMLYDSRGVLEKKYNDTKN